RCAFHGQHHSFSKGCRVAKAAHMRLWIFATPLGELRRIACTHRYVIAVLQKAACQCLRDDAGTEHADLHHLLAAVNSEVCKYPSSALIWSVVIRPLNEGIMPLPWSTVCCTCASVAGAPLGRVEPLKILCRFGGAGFNPKAFCSWQVAQRAS